jgi:hypothetical protein
MRAMKFLFAVTCLSITSLAQQGPFDSPSLEDFQALQRKMSQLEKKLVLLEKKLTKIEKKKKSTSSFSHDGFVSKKADPEVLAKITLEENPTEESVRSYLAKIGKASQNQNSFSTRDVQVSMLREIPSKYLKLVLSHPGHSLNIYIGYAIPDLVDETHKDLVIKYLLQHDKLVDSVIQYDWVDDAWASLLIGLKRDNHLSRKWISVVAEQDKEDGNKALLDYATRRIDNETLQMIKRTSLPKAEIKKAVLNNWKMNQYGHEWEVSNSAICAVQYGDKAALLKTAELMMSTDEDQSYNRKRAWPIFSSVLDHNGNALDWYKANKSNLLYDEVKEKFIIKSEG